MACPTRHRSIRRPLTGGTGILLALVLSVLACRPSIDVDVAGGHPVVVEVIDGDTLVVRIDGRDETVRLLGVDTPETVHPTRPPECFGAEASARLAELLPPGTPVIAERDVEVRDVYGRLLLHLHRIDGLFVNHDLVAGGYATTLVIPPNGAYASLLGDTERTARAEGRGLWGACGAGQR